MHVRRDDVVQVTAGTDRGKVGKVLHVEVDDGRVVVEGVNLRWKHLRRGPKNPQGGRVKREAPIAASRVLLRCEKCGRGVRTRHARKDGVRHRTCVKCGADLGAR